jgi:hypothetical protein
MRSSNPAGLAPWQYCRRAAGLGEPVPLADFERQDTVVAVRLIHGTPTLEAARHLSHLLLR